MTPIISLSPDAPVETNILGGKQSTSPYGFHLLPAKALFEVARIMKYGADKYNETLEDRNYLKVPLEQHLNHAIAHVYAFLAGDDSDDHLSHFATRAIMALEVYLDGIEIHQC
jgi:hypothetical protein